jgi:tRNA(Ile)-lysidine synthase
MRSSSASATNRPVPAAEAVAGTTGDGPLAGPEIAALLAPLEGARRIAVAVSGGADSLALLDCIDRWRKAPGRPDVVVLTVDHGLRPGSAVAAEMVKAIAEARGLPARVLVRHGPPPTAGVEAAARAARYRLLLEACRQEGVSHLAVAHQRDDVAETFLMRLKRGAGVFGLAAMRPLLSAGGVTLVRPFLAVPRARLAATTAAAGLAPVDDPMNRDPRFERTAVRRLLGEGELDPALFATLAMRFADLADAIDAEAGAFIADAVAADGFAVAWLDAGRYRAAPEEIRERVLVRLLVAVGGADYPPRSDRLGALHRAMVASDAARLKRTLAGAVIERRDGRFAVYRECGRMDLPSLPVAAGHSAIWDNRFAVAIGAGAPAGLTVGPLGEDGRREVGATAANRKDGRVPVGALVALPAIRQGHEILAAPVFRRGRTPFPVAFRSVLPARLAIPPLFPDFAA